VSVCLINVCQYVFVYCYICVFECNCVYVCLCVSVCVCVCVCVCDCMCAIVCDCASLHICHWMFVCVCSEFLPVLCTWERSGIICEQVNLKSSMREMFTFKYINTLQHYAVVRDYRVIYQLIYRNCCKHTTRFPNIQKWTNEHTSNGTLIRFPEINRAVRHV